MALCIAHAVLPKAQWLADRQVEAEWPVHGLFARLYLDNAKEFRSEALRRGCEQYGIGIDYRPVRTPHYGGHIEPLICTVMGKVHLLPETTFSTVRAKGDLDPQKTASMTIDELERWLAHAIAGVYHRTVHRTLGVTPLLAWERGILGDVTMPGCGEPVSVPDSRECHEARGAQGEENEQAQGDMPTGDPTTSGFPPLIDACDRSRPSQACRDRRLSGRRSSHWEVTARVVPPL